MLSKRGRERGGWPSLGQLRGARNWGWTAGALQGWGLLCWQSKCSPTSCGSSHPSPTMGRVWGAAGHEAAPSASQDAPAQLRTPWSCCFGLRAHPTSTCPGHHRSSLLIQAQSADKTPQGARRRRRRMRRRRWRTLCSASAQCPSHPRQRRGEPRDVTRPELPSISR